MPVLEHTELFKRAIGEHTDVVGKEMYTFTDRGGDSLTLRPEATAGIARALISNGMLRGQRHKLWCLGPMFRHETPQAGRYRQFWQVDVEAVGYAGPDVDAELIACSARLWQRLGIGGLKLEINSLGTPESRREYRARLVEYLRGARGAAGCRQPAAPERQPAAHPRQQEPGDAGDDRRRAAAHRVPGPGVARALRAAVRRCSTGSACRYRSIRAWCAASTTTPARCSSGSPTSTGAQNAVCSGGRYDGLIAQLGGEATPAIGFAMGVERLVALLAAAGRPRRRRGPGPLRGGERRAGRRTGLQLVERLRSAAPAAADRAELRRRQFQSAIPPRRQERGGAGPDRRRGRTRPRRGRHETFTRAVGSERVPDGGPGGGSGSGAGAAAARAACAGGMTWGGCVEDYLSEKEQWEWVKAQVRENAPGGDPGRRRRARPASPAGAGGRSARSARALRGRQPLHADGAGARARRPQPRPCWLLGRAGARACQAPPTPTRRNCSPRARLRRRR